MSRFAVQAPVKVTMLFVAILLLGWISLNRLPTNLFPDISAPRVTVTVRTTGLSPAEVEQRVAEQLERLLYSVRGVVGVQSIARADQAVVVVDFDWQTRMEYAFLEVKKAASDLQRNNTEEIDSVNVLRYDPNAAPVMTVALTAPPGTDMEGVRRAAEQTLKPRFERLSGVANVVLTGGMEREILISLDEGLLISRNISVESVSQALQNENVDASGGYLEEGTRRYLLKTVGMFEDLEDIREVVVGRSGEAPIYLRDVASVEYAPKEATSIVALDGAVAVGMDFYREAESNTVAVAALIRQQMDEASEVLPNNWELTVARDQSEFISAAIREVRNNALMGGLLAVLVLLVFLRDLRTTVIIAIAIPVSIIATFNLMYFQGLTLNLMTLGGLALGCGMLVDNAIVVLENIFRLRQVGMDRRESAMEGTRQVAWALVASTLTTVAVFLPIVYVQGVAALLFREQGLTVAYSLLASLVVALLLIPMLSAYFLSDPPEHMRQKESLAVPRGFYPWTLRLAVRLRWLVLLAAVGVAVLSAQLGARIPAEFLPATDVRQIGIRLVLPTGTPIDATNSAVAAVTNQLQRYEPFLQTVYSRVGEPEGAVNANTEDPDGPNTADFLLTLNTWDNPTTDMLQTGRTSFGSTDLIAGMKPVLDRLQDAKTEFRTTEGSLMSLVGGARAPLIVEIRGQELEELTRLANEARLRLDEVPQLLNVRTNILQGAPEVRLRLDRALLAEYGFNVQQVGNMIREKLEGNVATTIKQLAGDVDIRVEVGFDRAGLDVLRGLTLQASNGAIVRLDAIADMEIVRGPREVLRKEQQRAALVMADLAEGRKLSEGIAAAQAALSDLELPRRYFLEFTGEEEQRRAAFGDLGFALLLSIALVYMVMASIFESFLQPLIIMLTIPLAGIGVVGGLILTGQTFNVMSLIGIIMLGGIVVNNAIVLLDCVNQVRSDAAGRADEAPDLRPRDTLIIGCHRRLRPVLMTTATTMLGLLPMALGYGEGAELRQAMAITVLGGLFSSMLLTLYVIPCCQSILDSATAAVRRLAARFHKVEKAPPQQAPAQ